MNRVSCDADVSVIVVGAGPAGLGCAALLRQMGLPRDQLMVLERGDVGESFRRWPREMRLITPSFPSNGFHQTDLNAVTPDTSPAFSLEVEHPSGNEYADYLRNLVDHYDLPVHEGESVEEVEPEPDCFTLRTGRGRELRCRYLIWAGGHYQAPRIPDFPGVEHCMHNSAIRAYHEELGDHRILVGGYESGIDAAWHLLAAGKRVTLLEKRTGADDTYDPSCVLSPVSKQRLSEMRENRDFSLVRGEEAVRVEPLSEGYRLHSRTGKHWFSYEPPILCTGFEPDLGPVRGLFQYDEDGVPLLNSFDESTLVSRLFLNGPMLAYGNILLCFIYKFRGRFPVVCGAIGAELELDSTAILEHYYQAGMLLDDLSCCEDQQCYC